MKKLISTSGLFLLGKNDFIKGLIVAAIGGALDVAYKSLSTGSFTFDLKTIEHAAIVAGLAYLTKNWVTDNKTYLPTNPVTNN